MTYIFYKIATINNKNKRVYKKKNSRKLYCKSNGKMIEVKKYKELCKKKKPTKVKNYKKKRGGEDTTASASPRASPRASDVDNRRRVRPASARANVLEKDLIVLRRRPASAPQRASPRASPRAVSRVGDSLYDNLDSLLGISEAIYDPYFRKVLKQFINASEHKDFLLAHVKQKKEKYTNIMNLVELFDKEGGYILFDMANDMIKNIDKRTISVPRRVLHEDLIRFKTDLHNEMIVGNIFSLDNFLRYYSKHDNVLEIVLTQLIKFDRIDMKEEKKNIDTEAWNKIIELHKISELKELTVKEMRYLINLIVNIIYKEIKNANKLDKLNKNMNAIIRMAIG